MLSDENLILYQICFFILFILDSEPGTCSLQQQQAVQMVLSLFGVILRPVHDQLQDLSEVLSGSVRLPSKVFFIV